MDCLVWVLPSAQLDEPCDVVVIKEEKEDGKEEVIKKGEEQEEVRRIMEEGGVPGFVPGCPVHGC